MNKKEIRNKYKLIRSKIQHKPEKSLKICSVLMMTEEYKKAEIIALYAPLEDEVDTSPVINDALKAGKKVLLPKIESKSEMNFYETGSIFNLNALGIKEPQGTKKYSPEQIDLIIIPLVCTDEKKNRIGFGGGYYDRYLSTYKGTSIGICFDEQFSAEHLPCEEHDIKPDIILSDKRVIK